MRNRDEKILDAIKKFARPPNYGATWTQLKWETGLADGTLNRRLQSLLKTREIIHIGRLYSLPTYEQMLIEKVRAEETGMGTVPEEHVLNVVSGLKWFCRCETYLSGKVQPKAECALIALQHIYTGHREIFEHFENLLKAKDREDILKADIAQKLRIQLERAGLRLLSRTLEDMAESLLISRGDFNRYKKVEPVQEGARYKLLLKEAEPHSLGEFESREKAEEFWRETFAKFVETPEFKEAMIKYENARKESTEAYEILTGKTFPTSEEERVGKPCFLGMKLEQGLERLKGSCELCGGKFTKNELEKLNKILSMFSRGVCI